MIIPFKNSLVKQNDTLPKEGQTGFRRGSVTISGPRVNEPQQIADHFFQFSGLPQTADTIRQFVHRHGVTVMLPQELGFGNAFRRALTSPERLTLNRPFFRQFFQQCRCDSQAVAARQLRISPTLRKLAPITTVS